MAIIKKPIKKAQGGKLLRKLTDKIVSKGSNRMVDRIVKKPAGMTDKPVNYGKVVLTDAQKAKNAEILKNPGTATADSWTRAKKIAQKESDSYRAKNMTTGKTRYETWLEESNKPMVTRPGSPKISTLAKTAKSIKKNKAGGVIKKAKDRMWMQKAAASIKRRGTEGKCTPITKPGCTGKAKALAKTFKKIAKSNKKK